jgi:hypothetical protein
VKPVLAALFLLSTPAMAEIDVSKSIAQDGIATTLSQIESLDRPRTPAETFALAGLRFLSGIESALQLQWRTGMDQALGDASETLDIPLLRLSLPPNPTPAPFSGALVSQLFTDLDTGMEAARQDLAALPPDQDFGLEIAFSDLWFDVNANGARDKGEGAAEILGPQLFGWQWMDRAPNLPLPVIRFDSADAAWLMAYTHLLSGMSDLILAYDPAQAIDRALAARTALRVAAPSSGNDWSFDASFGQFMDGFAMLEGAINQPPNADRAHAAKAHLLQMVAENRRFWTMVALETDNKGEWIPNENQTSALGLALPPGAGNAWLAVLADGEALLTGRLLLPYWRGPEGQGINMARLFDDPRPVSVTGWIQGWGAVPYLEQGPVVDGGSLRRFESMMFGNSGLMMVFLN